MNDVLAILAEARKQNASDIHLIAGEPVSYRVSRRTQHNGVRAGDKMLESFLDQLLETPDMGKLRKMGAVDKATFIPEVGAIRVHTQRKNGKLAVSVRLLQKDIPTFQTLGLPDVFETFVQRTGGLVLIVGPMGSGKSSSLAATIHAINDKCEKHIYIVEDTIEYVHPWLNSTISQVLIGPGKDFATYEAAITASRRDDADVLVVGEARDAQSFAAILNASNNGNFVMATMHTDQTTTALDRIIYEMPPEVQERVRVDLAVQLVAIVGQRLVPRKGKAGGVVLATEVLIVTDQVREALLKNEIRRVRESMTSDAGMHTLEGLRTRLLDEEQIFPEDAIAVARYPDEVKLA